MSFKHSFGPSLDGELRTKVGVWEKGKEQEGNKTGNYAIAFRSRYLLGGKTWGVCLVTGIPPT